MTILDSKFSVCMDKNGKYTKYTSHIDRRLQFVINGDRCKMHNIDWCEGGLQLTDIATKNIGDIDLNPIMKYIMVNLDNW